jgi:DNA polymerase-3 subunit delta'
MSKSFLITGGNYADREEAFKNLYSQFKLQKAKFLHDPDLIQLTAENAIGIDQVRDLEHQLSLKPHSFPPKIGAIIRAEKLTIEAQNALLKILEEPIGDSILILTSPRQESLLTTVVSRCQLIHLPEKAEIELTMEEMKPLSQELEKILFSSPGKRILFSSQFKSREEAILFCQTQLVLWREILLGQIVPLSSLSIKEITATIRQIEKTLSYLQANINPRLALDNLLLSYPQTVED